MKTEELLAYQAMYAALQEALNTTWLEFVPAPSPAAGCLAYSQPAPVAGADRSTAAAGVEQADRS